MNDTETKMFIKLASRIHDGLARFQDKRWLEILNCLAGCSKQIKEMSSQSKKLGMALTHRWLAAAQRCTTSVSRSLGELQYSIQRAKQLIDAPIPGLPGLSLLIEELQALQQEFGSVDFDRAEGTLSVVTEPVTLEDVYLGPFRIQLQLDRLSELCTERPYRVIALEPNPAATDEAVTHPHVSNERLCEGDGAVAIRASLEQGRLSDFFTLVRSILNTYSPDSPYVALDDWHGQPCYDCGYTTHSEDIYYCGYCDHDYCSQCSTYCRSCEESICMGCSGECPQCGELVCPNCIRRCVECDELCCKSCLDEDMCPNCKEELEKENEEQEYNSAETDESRTPNQPQSSQTEASPAI